MEYDHSMNEYVSKKKKFKNSIKISRNPSRNQSLCLSHCISTKLRMCVGISNKTYYRVPHDPGSIGGAFRHRVS